MQANFLLFNEKDLLRSGVAALPSGWGSMKLQACSRKGGQIPGAPCVKRAMVMNVIAHAAFDFASKVTIVAFEVMNNHLHFVLSGDIGSVDGMLDFILKRIRRSLSLDRLPDVSSKPIEDLASMRNHIVYVHRNGYVANLNHTPFSYPWGTGPYYFSQASHGRLFSEITSVENRSMFRSRDVRLPSDWQVLDACPTTYKAKSSAPVGAREIIPFKISYVSPDSFCDITLGMALFRDAHHYFAAVSKNVEAYSGIAVELDDGEFLTDRSSNGQIRRTLGLGQYEIASLFPEGQ